MQIFYDKSLSEEERQRQLTVLANAGDEEARGYFESLSMIEHAKTREAEPERLSAEVDDAALLAWAAERRSNELFARVIPTACAHLERQTIPETGSIRELRERHLVSALGDALRAETETEPVSKRLPVPDWPSLGRSAVDIVCDSKAGTHVVEVKWCHGGEDKVYEAIWDLFKMALVRELDGIASAHLVTGCPVSMWETAFCADLFGGGIFEPEELCKRIYPTPSQRPGWDWLLSGGYDRFPERLPARIEIRRAGRCAVADGKEPWEVRAVSVHPLGDQRVEFIDGWPNGDRPSSAKHPWSREPGS